ncbi:unnamed protein product [Closterium sp. NIES-53]
MAEPQDPPHVLHELTERRDIDLLSAIFAKLPFKTILAASQVCRFWSHASEHLFHRECERKGWKPPRRPRGQTELSSFRPPGTPNCFLPPHLPNADFSVLPSPRLHLSFPPFPQWRSLFFRHACRSCGGKGEFIARHAKLPPFLPLGYLLCPCPSLLLLSPPSHIPTPPLHPSGALSSSAMPAGAADARASS